eukprot:1639665-Pyramimonas_sp.AAC.2
MRVVTRLSQAQGASSRCPERQADRLHGRVSPELLHRLLHGRLDEDALLLGGVRAHERPAHALARLLADKEADHQEARRDDLERPRLRFESEAMRPHQAEETLHAHLTNCFHFLHQGNWQDRRELHTE